MRWGILFRREISLTYARVQDIHLVSNVVERWLGLARIQIQTASGSSGAEMVIEGLQDFEAIRDFLYTRMRGVHQPQQSATDAATPDAGAGDVARAIREAAAELRAIRESIETGASR
jgi:putative membrane protein